MYGVIDIGSNTIRLNVYHVYNGGFKLILKNKVSAGLVNYIDSAKMNKSGIELASTILREMNKTCEALQLNDVLAFATAPLRNISNSDYAKKSIEDYSGLEIDVISGKEEASYSYRGAIYDIHISQGLVVDIGGGSTELVHFEDEDMMYLTSLEIGSLNMFNKYVDMILPRKKELKNIKAHTEKELEGVSFDTEKDLDIVGVGGTLRACLDINNYINDYDEDNNVISKKDLKKILKMLSDDFNTSKSIILKVKPDRIHTIMPGIRILKSIVKKYNSKKIYVSQFGVREGYLAKYLEDNNILNNAGDSGIFDIKFIDDKESIKNKIEKHGKK